MAISRPDSAILYTLTGEVAGKYPLSVCGNRLNWLTKILVNDKWLISMRGFCLKLFLG